MPQQINLCTPILLTQKRYFSAQTMVQALAVFLVLGGGLCAYWVWSLNTASEGFRRTLATQALELASLQAAIQQGKAYAAPVDVALTQELQSRRDELQPREKLMEALQRGRFQPGWGHAARLQLVAQSVPSQVWVTQVKADESQLDISGFTLEPAALNDWVGKLATSPLLQGQTLTTVKVESAITPSVPSTVASAPTTAPRAMWSFNLVSAVAKPAAAAGVKP